MNSSGSGDKALLMSDFFLEAATFVGQYWVSKASFISDAGWFFETADHTKYIYRQRTLQLLFEANTLQNINTDIENTLWNSFTSLSLQNPTNFQNMERKEEEQRIKQKLLSFLEELKKYMEDK